MAGSYSLSYAPLMVSPRTLGCFTRLVVGYRKPLPLKHLAFASSPVTNTSAAVDPPTTTRLPYPPNDTCPTAASPAASYTQR